MAEYIDRTQIKWYGCDHEGKACIDSGGDCTKCFFGNCSHDEVMNMKPADVAPVIHAKWEDGSCTNCHCDVPAYIIDWKWVQDMDAKYCPNCGAKMDKE